MKFLDNNKKITISTKLYSLLIKNLKNLKLNYKHQNKINKFLFLNKIIKAKIIKKVKNGYLLVDQFDNNCFLNSNKDLSIQNERYFYCYKIENNILKLRLDTNVAAYYANVLTDNKFNIFVKKWDLDRLLVFYYTGKKIGKENIKKLKMYFQNEKIIFNNLLKG